MTTEVNGERPRMRAFENYSEADRERALKRDHIAATRRACQPLDEIIKKDTPLLLVRQNAESVGRGGPLSDYVFVRTTLYLGVPTQDGIVVDDSRFVSVPFETHVQNEAYESNKPWELVHSALRLPAFEASNFGEYNPLTEFRNPEGVSSQRHWLSCYTGREMEDFFTSTVAMRLITLPPESRERAQKGKLKFDTTLVTGLAMLNLPVPKRFMQAWMDTYKEDREKVFMSIARLHTLYEWSDAAGKADIEFRMQISLETAAKLYMHMELPLDEPFLNTRVNVPDILNAMFGVYMPSEK
ncbi:MAG: hypothetical protein ABIA93_00070 [Candidatus Woesearchaeota archaeon]